MDIATGGPAAGKRALGKLKATITQRFIMKTDDGVDCEVDVDADCRLCFFVQRDSKGEWKTHFFKGEALPLLATEEANIRVPRFL